MALPIRTCPVTNTAGVDMRGRWLVIDTPELRGREKSEAREVRLRNRHIRDDGSLDGAGVLHLDRVLRRAGVIRTGEWKRSPTVRDYWVAPVRHVPKSELPPLPKPPTEPRTTCPKGHAYTPENTGWSSGRRRCRICHRAAARRHAARKRAARLAARTGEISVVGRG